MTPEQMRALAECDCCAPGWVALSHGPDCALNRSVERDAHSAITQEQTISGAASTATPKQLRALADAQDTSFYGDDVTAAALRAAADQLEAVRGLLHTTDPGNPYIYDPWSDESVDPTNMDEVVRAAVSAGWSKGAYELAKGIREALDGEVSND